ncbi:MAG: DUF2867 domain-containing protein, partial [Anaerolineales bacterium]|nr:DUF2867 domain-containing protein [Anaerolineales bacterium]
LILIPPQKIALEKTHPNHIERVWDESKSKFIKHEGCIIFHVSIPLPTREGCQMDRVRVSRHTIFGELWLEQKIRHVTDVTYVSQTLFFRPHGLTGFLYWYLLYPIYWLRFRALFSKIDKQP